MIYKKRNTLNCERRRASDINSSISILQFDRNLGTYEEGIVLRPLFSFAWYLGFDFLVCLPLGVCYYRAVVYSSGIDGR